MTAFARRWVKLGPDPCEEGARGHADGMISGSFTRHL
jgi:hypothetical protein